jgi:GNAT superfamily N-acetyltransferase
MQIRLATADDIPTVQRLLMELAEALGKTREIHGTEADLRRFGFGEQPRFQAMLAFDAEEAVGLAVFFSEYSTWRGVPGVYVQDLYVRPGRRGHGLGRLLLRAVKEHATSWGGRYVKLTVYDRNPAALAFYRKLGFEACDDELPLVLRY